jgi:hypothetical protein
MANTNSSLYTTTDEEETYVCTPTITTNKRLKKQTSFTNKKHGGPSLSPSTHSSRRIFNVPAERIEIGQCSSHSTPWEHPTIFNTTGQVHSDGFIKPKKTARPAKTPSPFLIPTQNSMAPLSDMLSTESASVASRNASTHITTPTVKKPPPIYIDQPPSEKNSTAMINMLTQLKVSASFRRYNEKQYIVYPHDEQAARTLLTHFTVQNVPFYTHAPRNIKKHKQYLILGLDINQPTIADIQQALSEIPDIINIRHMNKTDSEGNKYPIHPVVVTTLHTTTLDHFKHVNTICYYRVRIVKYNPTRSVAQCTNCQQFGHSRNYCKRLPVCVRCAGQHDVSECDKQHTTIKCFGCGGNHVSSYRQCPARLQLIEKKEARGLSQRSTPNTAKFVKPPPLNSFPPLPQQHRQIPGFTQSIPSAAPTGEAFSTSGFTELLSHFFQQFTSMLIHHIENTFKHMCATLLNSKK